MSLAIWQVFDILSLIMFLQALDCQYFYVPVEDRGYNKEFPEVYCWSLPHIIHASVAVIVSCRIMCAAAAVTTLAHMHVVHLPFSEFDHLCDPSGCIHHG